MTYDIRRKLGITLLAGMVAGACSYTEGECWLRSEDDGSPGAGGGPLVPGQGGYGDVPPAPQSGDDTPIPDCNIVSDNACNEKCLTRYEADAVECANLQGENQRKDCNDAAHAKYLSCRANCQKVLNECYDKCDEKAAEGHKICDGMKDGPGKAKCRQAVEEQRDSCYRDCNRK